MIKKLFVCLISMTLLGCQSIDTPEEVVAQWMEALQQCNLEKAYTYFKDDTFKKPYETLDENERLEWCIVLSPKEGASVVTSKIEKDNAIVTIKDDTTFTYIQLKKVEDQWYIIAI